MESLGNTLKGFYPALTELHRKLYKAGIFQSTKLDAPVIAVGNLSFGGSCKTPMAMAIAKYMQRDDGRPLILNRGYGSGLKRSEALLYIGPYRIELNRIAKKNHKLPSRAEADEAKMMAQTLDNIGVVVGQDRARAAGAYTAQFDSVTCYILDDGFQHHRIHKDLNVLMINPGDLNRGIWRRDYPSQAKLADALILTAHCPDTWNRIQSFGKPCFSIATEISGWKLVSKKATQPSAPEGCRSPGMIAAIASPERFLSDIRKYGYNKPMKNWFQRDHKPYSPLQLQEWLMTHEIDGILTTAKDYYRQPDLLSNLSVPVFTAEQSLRFTVGQMSELIDLLKSP